MGPSACRSTTVLDARRSRHHRWWEGADRAKSKSIPTLFTARQARSLLSAGADDQSGVYRLTRSSALVSLVPWTTRVSLPPQNCFPFGGNTRTNPWDSSIDSTEFSLQTVSPQFSFDRHGAVTELSDARQAIYLCRR